MRLIASYLFCLGLMIAGYLTCAQQQDDIATKLMKGFGDIGGKKKAQMDSVDFQFAISVNENAGFFDIEQKGEGGARLLYSLKDREDKTTAEIASDTLEIAISWYEARWYKLAEGAFLKAKQFMEENSLKEDVNYLRCLSNIGLVYLAQGRSVEAEDYINQSLKTSEATFGSKSAAYISNLNSRAKLDQMLGRYNEAEKAFDETLMLVKEVFTDKSMQYAVVLNNKAMLFQSVGRYDEAVNLMKQAIAAADAAPKKFLQGKKSFDSRRFQANLALLYQLSGKFQDADNTFNAIRKIFENRMQTNSLEYASLLNQIAILYIQMDRKDKVEEMLVKSGAIYKKRLKDENNPYYAKATGDLGNYYRMTARYKEAEPLLTKALAIREKVLGVNHPDYVRSKEDLAILYWKTGQHEKAYANYKEVMDATIEFINRYFPPMSEAEKTKFWDLTSPRFQRFFNFALDVQTSTPAIAEDVYDYHTATKALLLNTTSKVKQTILSSGDKVLIREYLAWLDKKESLARYYSLSKEELQQQQIDIAVLEDEANRMERSLSGRSADFSSGYSAQKVSFRQVRDLLTETEAVVEMIRLRSYDQDFTNDAKYFALVLTKGVSLPKIVLLENGQQLETRYAKYYRNAIQQRLVDDYSYDQYWARLEPALMNRKKVYLSLDGVFNQVNLNTLKNAQNEYVISKYDLIILGNSKDLIALKKKKAVTPKKSGVLLGFPDYGGTSVAALPGTKVEIEGILKILKTAGYQVQSYTTANASEKNMKSVKGPALMHIATHGYFLQDVETADNAFGVHKDNAGNNPLLRSGLLLAGAGRTVSGEASRDIESNDNGVLTAYEAMNLNLEGTELIVLSACETALGDVKNGEGVYGLQRAFLVAGADAMIMSLWKVDDEATQLLMTSFYTNWIKLRDKQRAFKQAQIQLMTKYKEPYYWGAFVMMGM